MATIIFARAPEPGEVKTRLIPALGASGACRLHEKLVRRTVATCLAAAVGPVYLACTPTTDAPLFAELCTTGTVHPLLQRGQDLGARMHAALSDVIKAGDASLRGALVVGCDIPLLDARDLRAAAHWLGCKLEDNPKISPPAGIRAVLGPALDGGYYLIGLREPALSLFEGVAWGGGQVIATTRSKLTTMGWHWRELTPRLDIDRPQDLVVLRTIAPELLLEENQ